MSNITVNLPKSSMAETFEQITEKLQKFINSQQLFFVATAPLSTEGLLIYQKFWV